MLRILKFLPAVQQTGGVMLSRHFQFVVRDYSTRPSFLSRLVNNIKNEMEKNKEMSENIKKFREEAQKLEHSDALKSARQKFNTVESEASKGSEVFKEQLESIKGRVQDAFDEAGKTEFAKKAGEISEGISKSARGVSGKISDSGKIIGQSGTFQSIRKEIDTQGIQGRVYKSPVHLRKRIEAPDSAEARIFQANTEDMGIELHKDSKFYQSWENFKNNNAYVNKVLDWKIQYEESENPVIRASRLFTDKVSDIMGNIFSKTELSETLTEICKIDPKFDAKQFLRDCENDIIPNVLEAMIRGDLDILKSWCFESTYNVIATPVTQAKQAGFYLDSKILDIENVDLVMGKVMDQGPVLIITFQTQQIMCVRNAKHEVAEGDPDKVMRVNYVWVLCRDPEELDPRSAWRLMELSANSSEQFV